MNKLKITLTYQQPLDEIYQGLQRNSIHVASDIQIPYYCSTIRKNLKLGRGKCMNEKGNYNN